MENLSKMAKASEATKKPEKSQAELRASGEARFSAMEQTLLAHRKQFQQALADNLFEDTEDEPEGSGAKRKGALQARITELLDQAEQLKAKLDSKEPLPNFTEAISATYTHPDKQHESITLDIEKSLQEFITFYQQNHIELPPDFEDDITAIWENNIEGIQQAIQAQGFNDLLLMPGNLPLPELHTKMTEGYQATWQGGNFKSGGAFVGAQSEKVDQTRIVLVHNTQNLQDRPELQQTLNITGTAALKSERLTLEDYLVFQSKYFKDTDQHLDEVGWTWLATQSGARLVNVAWDSSGGRVDVDARDLGWRSGNLGARPACSFF